MAEPMTVRAFQVKRTWTGPVAGHGHMPSPFAPAQIERLTTSFMISLVPPKIRVTLASRQSLAIRYSFM